MRTIENRPEAQANITQSSASLEADYNPTEQLTGCCSSLSIEPCNCASSDVSVDNLQDYCFDCNDSYSGVEHTTISREAILKSMNEYHGLCMSDENLQSFVDHQVSSKSSVELMMHS